MQNVRVIQTKEYGPLHSERVKCGFCKEEIESAVNSELKIIQNPHETLEIHLTFCPKCLKIVRSFLNMKLNKRVNQISHPKNLKTNKTIFSIPRTLKNDFEAAKLDYDKNIPSYEKRLTSSDFLRILLENYWKHKPVWAKSIPPTEDEENQEKLSLKEEDRL